MPFFLGLVTYGRLLECGMQDVFYARSISRIRQLYRELDPSRAHYFHEVGVDQGGPPTPELVTLRVQQFLPASAMVAIVNSVVGGVFHCGRRCVSVSPANMGCGCAGNSQHGDHFHSVPDISAACVGQSRPDRSAHGTQPGARQSEVRVASG